MITARVRLVSSMWFRASDDDDGITESMSIRELRPLEKLEDEQLVDDNEIVGVIAMIDFDGLVYRITIDNQRFVDSIAIVEGIITSQYAKASFDDSGVMQQLVVDETTYHITSVELIGPSKAIDFTYGEDEA